MDNDYAEFQEISKISFWAEIVFFEWKSKQSKLGWIHGFLRIHPIYNFRYFPENGHFDNGYFRP